MTGTASMPPDPRELELHQRWVGGLDPDGGSKGATIGRGLAPRDPGLHNPSLIASGVLPKS